MWGPCYKDCQLHAREILNRLNSMGKVKHPYWYLANTVISIWPGTHFKGLRPCTSQTTGTDELQNDWPLVSLQNQSKRVWVRRSVFCAKATSHNQNTVQANMFSNNMHVTWISKPGSPSTDTTSVIISPIFTSPVAAGANGPRPICTVNTNYSDTFWPHVITYLTFSGLIHTPKTTMD